MTKETRKKLATLAKIATTDPVAAQMEIERRVAEAVARMRALIPVSK